jgi:hypothetical protein
MTDQLEYLSPEGKRFIQLGADEHLRQFGYDSKTMNNELSKNNPFARRYDENVEASRARSKAGHPIVDDWSVLDQLPPDLLLGMSLKQGRAMRGVDFRPVNMHHNEEGLIEVLESQHLNRPYRGLLHGPGGAGPNPVNRPSFNKGREGYWKDSSHERRLK